MKLPVSMLRDLVTTSLSAEAIGDLLTMAGFEVEELIGTGEAAVLDLKVMANRGDGLSALGLAREVLAKQADSVPTALYNNLCSGLSLGDESDPAASARVTLRIDSANCTRYAFRIFDDIENGPSPEWLVERLTQAGQRSISLIVDLTNYVMLELGQPLHAFDLDTLMGPGIVVRQAGAGEKLTTLNGIDHDLTTDHLLICDTERAVAVAGVMGGAETEVGPATKRVLLESAHFVNTSVRKTRKQLGLNTDASYRFERSVDPLGVVRALNRFAQLYNEITGKSAVPGVSDEFPASPTSRTVRARLSRSNELLGMDIQRDEAERYLSALGFQVEGDGEPFVVAVPSWRPDIEIENDVIEELARVHGYERIPETMPTGATTRGGVFGVAALVDAARDSMLRCGFTQIMSHSLRDKHPLDFKRDLRVGPRNPHSPEMAYLRDSLLPGLAEAAQRNGGRNLHLFEVGRVFVRGEYQIDESPELSILSTGALTPGHWQDGEGPSADFFSLKGAVEELAQALGDHIWFDYPRDPDPRFHPTRQSGVLLDGNRSWAGTIGQIHPDIASDLGLPRETFLAELDLLVFAIHDNAEPSLRAISRNPAVRRDIAVLIPKSVPYSQIESSVAEACGSDLEKQWLFDVYEGKGIEPGHHSLAIALQIRRMGENLTDEVANDIRDRAVQALNRLGGVQR
ncbi:MAG: phenylalanine--tRNA ligase subunit beta [Chthonomonas sp.]|nr:phenylalanine--tRNA ligase subunit beta [Chthonomonas sp.]